MGAYYIGVVNQLSYRLGASHCGALPTEPHIARLGLFHQLHGAKAAAAQQAQPRFTVPGVNAGKPF